MEFNWYRFSNLLKRDFILYGRKIFLAIFLLILITFFGVVVGHNLINLTAGGGIQALLLMFVFLLWIGGGWFTSTNLGDFQSTASRIHYISLPTSSLEKILSKWLYTLPLYALILSAIIWLFFKGYLWMFSEVLPSEVWPLAERMEKMMAVYFLQLYIFGHSIAFFCSFYFNNYVAIKGALSSLLILLGAGLIWAIFRESQGLGLLEVIEVSTWELINFVISKPIILLLISPVFWLMAFWVFKRKAA